jgi:hypothetical protein
MKTAIRNTVNGLWSEDEYWVTGRDGEETAVSFKAENPECEECSRDCMTGTLDNCRNCPFMDSLHIDLISGEDNAGIEAIQEIKADFLETMQESRSC